MFKSNRKNRIFCEREVFAVDGLFGHVASRQALPDGVEAHDSGEIRVDFRVSVVPQFGNGIRFRVGDFGNSGMGKRVRHS